jgi:hypothetical protein
VREVRRSIPDNHSSREGSNGRAAGVSVGIVVGANLYFSYYQAGSMGLCSVSGGE